jgi:hypothetical protein
MANIRELFGLDTTHGHEPTGLTEVALGVKIASKDLIGIEVEVENVKPTAAKLNRAWALKNDGSLRNDGYEFVTQPIEAHYAPPALHHLLKEYLSTECCFSPRTSVHVHLNMKDFDTEQVIDFLVVYSVFERLLYRFAGRGRIKNIYCVPVTETHLLRYFVSTGVRGIANFWSKYTGLNLLPLRELGTVEFRHMHGTFDVEKLSLWIGMITSLKEYIRKTPTKEIRATLFQMNDTYDFESFMRTVFGEYAQHLKLKKSICIKNTNLMKIAANMAADSPFFKGLK